MTDIPHIWVDKVYRLHGIIPAIFIWSRTGNTKKMAEFIAEGIRMTGNTAEPVKIYAIKSEKDLEGYDGFVFGCPTYHRDLTEGMKRFLFVAEKANLVGNKFVGLESKKISSPSPESRLSDPNPLYKVSN